METSSQKSEPRNFIKSFFENYRLAYKMRGVIGVLPYKFLLLCVVPLTVIHYFEIELPNNIDSSEFINLTSSVIVFSGILGAFSVSSIAQVQSIISNYPFSDYLIEEGLFNQFSFIPQHTFFLQCLITTISMIFVFSEYLFGYFSGNYEKMTIFFIWIYIVCHD